MPNNKESIYLEEWLDVLVEIDNEKVKLYDNLYSIKPHISRVIEEARNKNEIGSSLECELSISCNKHLYNDLDKLSDELKFIFIVSTCNIILGKESDNYSIRDSCLLYTS